MADSQKEVKKPFDKFRIGGVVATVWENTNKENEVYHTVALERNYKDKDDKWQTTNSYRINDLPKIMAVTRRAYEKLMLVEGTPEKQDTLKEENIGEK